MRGAGTGGWYGLALAVMAVFGWTQWQAATTAPAAATHATAAVAASPTARFAISAEGCPVPRARAESTPVERVTLTRWTHVAAATDRLGEDACGRVFGVWYRNLDLLDAEAPDRVRPMPTLAPLGRFDPIDAWLGTAQGELWLWSSQAGLHRLRADAARFWSRTELGCGTRAALAEFAGSVWLACDAPAGLRRFDRDHESWSAPGAEPLPSGHLLRVAGPRLLLASGARLLAIDATGKTTVLADQLPAARYLDARDGHIAWASGEQLLLIEEASGKRQRFDLSGEVRGLALRPGGRVWTAHWMRGLRYFDGTRWHAWTHATGLPDNEARALLLDRAGRLWLAATRSAVIRVEEAERQIVALQPPAPLPAQVFADACAAAQVEALAAAADRPRGATLTLAFDAEVWCPDAGKDNAEAGALLASPDGRWSLAVAFDGRKTWSQCGQPCSDAQRPHFVRAWAMTRYHHDASGHPVTEIIAPPERPTETPRSVAIANDGRIAAATTSTGLHLHEDGRWLQADAADPPWPRGSELLTVRFDRSGALWVQSRDARAQTGGLHRQDGQRWDSWPLRSFGGDYTPVLRSGSRGVLLATYSEAARVEAPMLPERDPGAGEGIHRFGAPNGTIDDLVEDGAGGLWLAYGIHRPGIGHLDAGGKRTLLTGRDGLFAEHVTRIARDREGRLWLRALDGRVAVYAQPALLREHAH